MFLNNVSHSALKDLIQFMYCGEVNVKQDALPAFISTAESLQIKGLTDVSTKYKHTYIHTCNFVKPRREHTKRLSRAQYIQSSRTHTHTHVHASRICLYKSWFDCTQATEKLLELHAAHKTCASDRASTSMRWCIV